MSFAAHSAVQWPRNHPGSSSAAPTRASLLLVKNGPPRCCTTSALHTKPQLLPLASSSAAMSSSSRSSSRRRTPMGPHPVSQLRRHYMVQPTTATPEPASRMVATAAAATSAAAAAAGSSGPPAPSSGFLGTVISDDKKACWLAPQGGSKAAKGVVLFMHGFSQGPNAYYKMLKELADSGLLVVAPVPPLAATPGKQQAAMVDFALHFQEKIYTNSLTGLPLASTAVAQNTALLAHSVGAGLSSYVAAQVANERQPFKAVMYLAPQTAVVDEYAADVAIESWPKDLTAATEFGLQYGLKDILAPPPMSEELESKLQAQGLPIKAKDIKAFPQGTHVGFQDQVVLGDSELVPDVLPWLNPLLLALVTIGFPFASSVAIYLRRLLGKEAPEKDDSKLASKREAPGKPSAILQAASSKALISPQDFALLEQGLQVQAARELQPETLADQGLLLRKLWRETEDGIGPEEEVKFASAESSTSAYYYLLLVAVVLFLGLGWASVKGLTDGDGSLPWLPLLGTGVAGYCVYQGWTNLQLLSYVNTVQRPQSREFAKNFMRSNLL